MSLRDFWARFSKKNSSASYKNLDKKLISGLKSSRFPTWPQFKYLGRFLSVKEKRCLIAALSVVGATLLFWLGVVVKTHITLLPDSGGEYIEALIGQPKYLNPIFSASNEVDGDLTPLIYSGLFRYSNDKKLLPDLAMDYSVSADKKTYTIALRHDVKWADNELFDANDVVFTVELIQNPEVGSPLAPAFQGITIAKIDDYRVSFTLKEPFAPFLNSLTLGILPEHIWADITPGSIRLAKNNIQPIGTGPWQFSKMVKDDTGIIQSYSLTRNDKYYQKLPYLKTLTFKFYSDYNQAIEALRGQTVQAISFLPNNLKEKITSKNIATYSLFLPQYTALFFNDNQQANLKDSDVRQALAMGINKETVVREALSGNGGVINAPILPGQLGYYPDIKIITNSVDSANALLDKNWTRIQPEEYFNIRSADLLKERQTEIDVIKKNPSSTPAMVSNAMEKIQQEISQSIRAEMTSGQTFYRKHKAGKILSLTITTADTPEYRQTAEVITGMWRALGIQTAILTSEPRQISRAVIKDRSYQILLYSEIVGADPDLYPFWHSSQTEYPGLNLAQYANRAADNILEDARAASSTAEREKLYKQFQDIINKDLPAIFLYTPYYNFVASKEIKGININNILSPADRYNGLDNWYIKTSWQWK